MSQLESTLRLEAIRFCRAEEDNAMNRGDKQEADCECENSDTDSHCCDAKRHSQLIEDNDNHDTPFGAKCPTEFMSSIDRVFGCCGCCYH